MLEQYDQSRKKVSRKLFFLGAAEVLLGVLFYLWALELLPIPPFPCTGVLSALGFVALGFGAYLLYWGGALWQQADDPERWRQTASQMIGKYRSSPALLPVVAVGLVMLEWTLRGTTYTVFLLMELVPLELMLFPILWEMRRL